MGLGPGSCMCDSGKERVSATAAKSTTSSNKKRLSRPCWMVAEVIAARQRAVSMPSSSKKGASAQARDGYRANGALKGLEPGRRSPESTKDGLASYLGAS